MTASELNETYRDTDMDGLPDRIDSAPTIPQYYCRVEKYQAEYLHDYFGQWFEVRNGIVRVRSEDEQALKDALAAAEELERQHERVDNCP